MRAAAEERFRVVLVEDDRDLAEVTQLALEHEGLDVSVAYDGRQGLELIASARAEVVITDLVMPVMDGLELIQRLAQQAGPPVPVIAVSAIGSRLHAARALGAVEALVKPVHPGELAACARRAFRRSRA